MWYVVQVQARHEIAIAEQCRKRILLPGEDAFVMLTERAFRQGKEWVIRQEPAFQKYLFAEINDVTDFRLRLRKIKEMTKLLGMGEEIVPIRKDEEDMLKMLGGKEHIIRVSKCHAVGDRLVISSGPLAGNEGIVRWVNKRQHVAGVAITLLGQETTVKIGMEFLKDI